MGIYCEEKLDYCQNVTCQNNGVCRGLLLDYRCECLGDSYSGRYCETTSRAIVINAIVAKGFAFTAIIVMIATVLVIVAMDVLKYGFGIDTVVKKAKKEDRRKARGPKKTVLAVHFVYIH